jgi:hypothetical protein
MWLAGRNAMDQFGAIGAQESVRLADESCNFGTLPCTECSWLKNGTDAPQIGNL